MEGQKVGQNWSFGVEVLVYSNYNEAKKEITVRLSKCLNV